MTAISSEDTATETTLLSPSFVFHLRALLFGLAVFAIPVDHYILLHSASDFAVLLAASPSLLFVALAMLLGLANPARRSFEEYFFASYQMMEYAGLPISVGIIGWALFYGG